MKLPTLPGFHNPFPRLKAQGGLPKKRPFHTAQIELTSRCSTGCIFCPHDALVNDWVSGDMPLEPYRENIVPHLDLFELVYLQGWGEPMLHPGLWEMLELARGKGCRTGFTTNGAWLQEDNNHRIIEAGVDLISVSFAGSAAPIHESLRVNSNMAVLCRNFESLANLKKLTGSKTPWLELHFLMTRRNLSELPGLIELASRLGADEVVATNLAYSPTIELDHMRVFAERPLQEDLEILACAEQAAARLGIPLRIYPLQTQPSTLVCDADPMHSVYINYRGDVSACVYLGLTVNGQIPRFYGGESHPFDPLIFGNIRDGFPQALQGKRRREFINPFKRRNVNSDPLAMFTYLAGQQLPGELPPPPEPCRFCYKMLGI